MKLVDINNEFLKVKNQLPTFPDFKKKNLAMAILAAQTCGLKDHLIYGKIKKINDVNENIAKTLYANGKNLNEIISEALVKFKNDSSLIWLDIHIYILHASRLCRPPRGRTITPHHQSHTRTLTVRPLEI